ncbi:MAG: DUF4340 domain-containing protein, partial [Planctomycetes bacterium]|nr:DUF4340 domain-containing protein [Planctomycetota bacterium]
MSKTNLILAVLAAVQVIVLIVVRWTGGTTDIKSEVRGPLLSFDIEKVSRIEIDDGDDDREIVLARSASGWVVASEEDYPANATKIDQGTGILDKLAKVVLHRPVLRKAENQAPVKVADDAYARRIILKDADGQELGRYFLAAGSSGRSAYLRRGGDDPVFETQEISPWELGTYPSAWFDTT